ncbi:MAG: hypothetical protein U1F59_09455 [Candidatus Competibacteraceae bacterium]
MACCLAGAFAVDSDTAALAARARPARSAGDAAPDLERRGRDPGLERSLGDRPGTDLSENDAALAEAPFARVLEQVEAGSDSSNREKAR